MAADEDAVQLIVANYEGPYREMRRIIERVCWWDDDDQTWNDLDSAARQYRDLVKSLDPTAPGMTDLQDIDVDSVDFHALIVEELEQVNLDEGRECGAGL